MNSRAPSSLSKSDEHLKVWCSLALRLHDSLVVAVDPFGLVVVKSRGFQHNYKSTADIFKVFK